MVAMRWDVTRAGTLTGDRTERPRLLLSPRRRLALILAPLLAAFLALGLLGLWRYLDGYWLYRGYPPPQDPAFVTEHGQEGIYQVTSAALGGRTQRVIVYLPPGYATSPDRRYPVFYLLHGTPGRPDAFMLTVRLGVIVDVLHAQRRALPPILVMPTGSSGTFADEEWANGVGRHAGWETFVADDLVRWVDSTFRTIPKGAARAIGGLSEGGYGALNIAFHHPGEFGVVQSWSGYQLADNIPAIFGRDPQRLAHNSPALTLPRVAAALRRTHTFIWFYSSTRDPMLKQNQLFARELARLQIANTFFVVPGGHTWHAWRDNAEAAILAAAKRLAHA